MCQGSPLAPESSSSRRTTWLCTSCPLERRPRSSPPAASTASPSASLPSPTSSPSSYGMPLPVSRAVLQKQWRSRVPLIMSDLSSGCFWSQIMSRCCHMARPTSSWRPALTSGMEQTSIHSQAQTGAPLTLHSINQLFVCTPLSHRLFCLTLCRLLLQEEGSGFLPACLSVRLLLSVCLQTHASVHVEPVGWEVRRAGSQPLPLLRR